MKQLFVEFSLVSDFFRSKKSRIHSYFLLFSNKKNLLFMKKFESGKAALRSSMSTRILSKYPPHPAFNFEVMKWCWTNKRIINKLFCETANIQLRKFKFKGLKLVWYHSSNLISFICSKFCEALLWPNIITVLSNAPKQQFEYWDF